jgi:hypothetical protein
MRGAHKAIDQSIGWPLLVCVPNGVFETFKPLCIASYTTMLYIFGFYSSYSAQKHIQPTLYPFVIVGHQNCLLCTNKTSYGVIPAANHLQIPGARVGI